MRRNRTILDESLKDKPINAYLRGAIRVFNLDGDSLDLETQQLYSNFITSTDEISITSGRDWCTVGYDMFSSIAKFTLSHETELRKSGLYDTVSKDLLDYVEVEKEKKETFASVK